MVKPLKSQFGSFSCFRQFVAELDMLGSWACYVTERKRLVILHPKMVRSPFRLMTLVPIRALLCRIRVFVRHVHSGDGAHQLPCPEGNSV